MTIANQLLASFGRIAATDGGELQLIDASEFEIRLGYRPGGEADCEDSVCSVAQNELEEMIRAWLARKAPQVQLEIERLPA